MADTSLGDIFVAMEGAEKWTMEQDEVGDIIFFHRETQVGFNSSIIRHIFQISKKARRIAHNLTSTIHTYLVFSHEDSRVW